MFHMGPSKEPCHDFDPQGCAVNSELCQHPVLSVLTCPRTCNKCGRCIYYLTVNIQGKIDFCYIEKPIANWITFLKIIRRATRLRRKVIPSTVFPCGCAPRRAILCWQMGHYIKLMKGKALRKHSLHEKTAASVLLKLFISGNE